MKYWDEYQTKWGFGDGDSMPPDAEALRHVYIREINRKAVELGSKVRLIAYDRPGCHNCYLILRVPAELVAGVPELDLCTGATGDKYLDHVKSESEGPDDEAMTEAIEYFRSGENEDLDELTESDVRIIEEEDPNQTELTEAQKRQLDDAMATIERCMRNALKGFVDQHITEECRQRIIKAAEAIDSVIETDVKVTLTETDDPNVLDMTITKSVKWK